jgi:hypothetical protein
MPNENLVGSMTLMTGMRLGAPAKTDAFRKRLARLRRFRPGNDLLFLLSSAVLLGVALTVARSGMFTASSNLSYWIGVAGGTSMLLLLLYPLRKRWPRLRHVATMHFWFAFHMMLGVAGPLLIIAHSTLEFGSLNATVAFASMALVSASGFVGRYLYSRIHLGLYGRRVTLGELRAQAGLDSEEVHSKLAYVPEVAARLDEFAKLATAAGKDALVHPLEFMLLGWRAKVARRRCTREAVGALRQRAAAESWSREKLSRRVQSRSALIQSHLLLVQRVAQFGVFERLFSWWHVLHVPLVYMMVFTAIAHVVAVHIY